MTADDIADLLASGAERSDVEFKGPGRSDDKRFFGKVVRAVLALSNRRDGGVVLIGVDERPGSAASPVGIDATDLVTWTADVVRDRLAVFADPSVDVHVEHHSIEGHTIVVIVVHEFVDIPVICRRDAEELREGAIYVRSRRKPESVELPRQGEMRDLLELATEKRLRSFLATASAAGLIPGIKTESPATDEQRFAEQASAVGSTVASKARSRGYWTVSISPASFSRRRVENVAALWPIMQQSAVSYRGWPYPSVLTAETPEIGKDFIAFDIDSRIHVESWRLYQSGHFAQVMGFWEDWYEQDFATGEPMPAAGETLGADLAVGTLTEIFEFASRLALSAAGGPNMVIRIGAHRLERRHLTLPRTVVPFSMAKVATITEFDFDPLIVETALLSADSDKYAAQYAQELFRRFGWDASIERIRSWQERRR